MRTLADAGTTILVSSHLLAEVQQVCDEVTIISHGRVVRSGVVSDVLSTDGAPGRLRVGVDEIPLAAEILAAAGLSVRRDGSCLLVDGVVRPPEVTRMLAAQGLYVSELRTETVDLEDVFLSLTDDTRAEQVPA